MVEFPLIIINLKTYQEAMGERAMRLAVLAEEVSKRTGVSIALSPQATDLRMVVEGIELPVFAQHVDPVNYGKYTGHTLPEAVASVGCSGTLISHSERRLKLDDIEATVKRAKEAGLFQVVCVDTVERGRKVAPFGPDAIAIEPPELIGTGISVSKSRPDVVSGAVKAVKCVDSSIKVICGAGITSGKDVAAALRLGAEGILVASGVVKAEDPYEVLLDLAEAAR